MLHAEYSIKVALIIQGCTLIQITYLIVVRNLSVVMFCCLRVSLVYLELPSTNDEDKQAAISTFLL